jgi:hypothetical protein
MSLEIIHLLRNRIAYLHLLSPPPIPPAGRQGNTHIICKLVEMGKKTDTSKPAAAPAPATKAVAAKKPAAKKAATKSAVTKAKKTILSKVTLTQDDIALRAYFIAEKRQKAGLPGSPHLDWVEAERQLLAEGKKRPSAR